MPPRAPKAKKAAPFKAGAVAIIGRPNTGKSTLLNVFVKFKLSAVSPRPQTTRHKVLGIATTDRYQIAFLDTPGIPYRAQDELNRRLLTRAVEALDEADLVVMLVEPRPPGDIERRLVEELKKTGKPAILAVNKIDLVKKPDLLPVMDAYSRLHPFLEIVPISALMADGLDVLLEAVLGHLPEGEPQFPPEEITDRTERFLASEIIREQVFNIYAQEVPYAVAVEVETFRERDEEHGGKDYISATLYVQKDSQKGILIGRGGEMLKKIGTQARQAIEALLQRPVHLELWVKVYPHWSKDKAFLQRIGY